MPSASRRLRGARSGVAAALLAFAAASAAAGPEAAPAPTPGEDPGPELSAFARELARNLRRLASEDNLTPLALGLSLTGSAVVFDDEVRDYFAPTRRFRLGGEVGEVVGHPALAGGVAGALLLAAYPGERRALRRLSFTLGQGVALSGGLTLALKATGRERPDGSDSLSFPSGHVSISVACATVLHRFYGRRAGLIAYGTAGFIGFSRLEENEHFLSDVAAGAALGWLVGRTVAQAHGRPQRSPRLVWGPLVAPRTAGLWLALRR